MQPRVKPHIAFVPMGEDALLVRGPTLFLNYSGEAVPVVRALLPLMDGTRSVEDLSRAVARSAEDTREIVQSLLADRVVEDALRDEAAAFDTVRFAPQVAVWSHLSSMPAAAQNRIGRARIALLGEGAVADAAARILEGAGVGAVIRAEKPTACDHLALASDFLDPPRFLEVNEACLREGIPWTGAFLDGIDASVGPTVIPRQTACWRCYDLRAKGAHPNMDRLMAYEAARPAAAPFALPSFAPLVGSWLSQAVLVAVSGATSPPLAGHVARVELLEMRSERHRVLRIPRCPACSTSDIPDVDRYTLGEVEVR